MQRDNSQFPVCMDLMLKIQDSATYKETSHNSYHFLKEGNKEGANFKDPKGCFSFVG